MSHGRRDSLAVVMATRNGARWLEPQLASLAGQTRPPDRLVVSDDASEDATPALVRAFADRAPFPVTILEGPGTGLADNFWEAAAHAGTDLVAWADQDDVWHPEKLARCQAALAERDADLVAHAAQVVDDRLHPTGAAYPGYRRTAVLGPLEGDPWHVPSGFASVFRARLLADVPFAARPRSHQTGRPMNHDHAVSLRAFTSGRRVELAESLARYRQHGHNAAGDPSVRGLAALRRAREVSGEHYAAQAEIAREQGAFAASLPGAAAGTARYFEALAERGALRAGVYGRRAGLAGRGRRLVRASRAGVYRPRSRGGFGRPALARDATAVVLAA